MRRSTPSATRRLATIVLAIAVAAAAAAALAPTAVAAPDKLRKPRPEPAPTGLVVTGASLTSVSISWNASTNPRHRAYGVYRNGAPVAETTSTSYTVGALACGSTYELGVDSVDLAGTRSARAVITASTGACPDTTAPTTPTNLVAAAQTRTSISLSWTGSIDAVGVSGYGIYSNGTKLTETVATSHTIDGLACGTTYTVGVDAYDAAGNRSTRATLTVATSICADTQPPSVPQNQRIDSTTPTTIGMSWSPASDNVGVAGYAVYMNGIRVATTTQTSYTYPSLACGTTYTVGLAAFDAAGNSSDPAYASGPATTQGCASDTSAPTAPAGLGTTGVTQTSISVSWSASSDDVAVAGYGRYRDGSLVSSGTGTTYTYGGLTCGTAYAIGIDAYDAAGNRSGRTSITATTAACTPSSPTPPAGTANLWVDPSGGSCVRKATPGTHVDAEGCSWNQAYQAAQSGDLILVRGGSYGDVTIGPNRSITGVTFQPVSGESVAVVDFENGHIAGSTGASNVTFAGPVTARTFRSDRASNVVVDGWNVDCGGCVGEQIFHLEAASNVIVRNSEISDNTDNSLIWISGSNLAFENNRIHDAGLRAGSGAHTECLYAWNVTDLTLKRNHFYHCAVMDVFITGSSVANGGYIENNVFEKPWTTTGVISNSAYAFHFRNGGDPSPDPSNWDFLYNTFVGPLSISGENPVGAGGMRVVGNVFLSDVPCGKSNTTYTNNAFISGGCGAGAIVNSLSTYQAGFTSVADPGNYSLRSTSVLRDRGAATYPPFDRVGVARPSGAAADIGAYEYAG